MKIPERLLHSMAGADGGREWLERLPGLVERAVERWGLTVGAPFEDGMSGWAAPVTHPSGAAVLKISYPHDEARHEAAALRVWDGHGAVRLLDSCDEDWALLLRRATPGTALRDEPVQVSEQIAIGARLLRQMGAVEPPAPGPFPALVTVADRLAGIASERLDRLGGQAPVTMDRGLVRHAVGLLRTLPRDPPGSGLAHGDLNPGNILRDDADGTSSWLAIDPKAVVGDLAWDPWPLLTQLGDWTTTVTPAGELADRTRLFADLTGLEPARIAAWSVARSVESALWAADRGWWTGLRGADGDLARAHAWDQAAGFLGAG